ncbi:MAG: hypothetical protein WCF26_26575 [Candidatus Sulfotelmatobacter sp.]
MEPVELKLKQASAVLGMPTKELQNLVQFGVVKPRRRRGLYFFDMQCLYQAQVAGHLKLALGTPANRLTEFVEAFSEFLKRGKNVPDVLVFRSSSKYWTRSVEVRLPFKELRDNLEARLLRVDLYRDLPRGRKRPNWKEEFLATLKEASQDVGDVAPRDLQRAVREYRTSKKEKPEITVVAEAAQV